MGSTMNPNMSPMLRGSNTHPSSSPSELNIRQMRGSRVTTTAQLMEKSAWTPGECTTLAIGKTMTAAMRPWTSPKRTLDPATSHTGHGAWTRSSISRVNPNSVDSCRATAWTPWNMVEIPTTPGTSTVANPADPAAPPPTDWPICGKTYRNTK